MTQDIPRELELILNSASPTDQLLPADALYVLREGIKEFNTREKKLRQLLINDADARIGEWRIARLSTFSRTKLDEKLLLAEFGDLSSYKKRMVYPAIRLRRNKS